MINTPKYRLLNSTDTILPSDEYLTDDCITWEKLDSFKFGIGKPYSISFFQPMRRIINEPEETL
jgi:hypothetical protein